MTGIYRESPRAGRFKISTTEGKKIIEIVKYPKAEHEIVWRFGWMVVEEEPDLFDYDPEEGILLGQYKITDSFELTDICGEDWDFDDLQDQKRIMKFWYDDNYIAMEKAGYIETSTDYLFKGSLEIEYLGDDPVLKAKWDKYNQGIKAVE
jgi:hypothetical protein